MDWLGVSDDDYSLVFFSFRGDSEAQRPASVWWEGASENGQGHQVGGWGIKPDEGNKVCKK